jgi:hypothetical protein
LREVPALLRRERDQVLEIRKFERRLHGGAQRDASMTWVTRRSSRMTPRASTPGEVDIAE